MKQLFIKSGKAHIEHVADQQVLDGCVLVKTLYSCVSVGTEMAGVRSSSDSLFKRATKDPEKIVKALKLFSEKGFAATKSKALNQLGSPSGYSCVGEILEIGNGVDGYKVGDFVSCSGAQYANHAELVVAPVNLISRVGPTLDYKYASTATIGAIALQGVRRFDPKIGEIVGVVGLGIIGQLTVQILKANGIKVVAIDIDASKMAIAKSSGADIVLDSEYDDNYLRIKEITNYQGLDGVIITAASSSDEILSSAFGYTRKKGKVVLVGDVGLNINRADIYEKELDFLVSTSYGPGRYDKTYEEDGKDYPYSYVRWTEQRNISEYLNLLETKKVRLDKIPHKNYLFDDAPKLYEALKNDQEKSLLITIEYPTDVTKNSSPRKNYARKTNIIKDNQVTVSFIGAGSFASGTLLPQLEKQKSVNIRGIHSRRSLNAHKVANQFSAIFSTSDPMEIINDEETNCVFITSRHSDHGSMVIDILDTKKNIFVEKPLTLEQKDLSIIDKKIAAGKCGDLMVGYNRRFSKIIKDIKSILDSQNHPISIDYHMNAGFLDQKHWTQGIDGGGRNLGEACHIYDLFLYLTDSFPMQIKALPLIDSSQTYGSNDNFKVIMSFDNGSIASLTYTALGANSFPKEQMIVSSGTKTIHMNDYRYLDIFSGKTKISKDFKKIDKGHAEEIENYFTNLKKNKHTIPWTQLKLVSKISFDIEKQLTNKD